MVMTEDVKDTHAPSGNVDIDAILAQNDEEWHKRFLLLAMIMIIILLGVD